MGRRFPSGTFFKKRKRSGGTKKYVCVCVCILLKFCPRIGQAELYN